MKQNEFKNKKVLVFGLGLLGGGVATTNWFLKHGAKVTVTDLKTKEQLAPSLKKIKGKVVLRLGGHSVDDIRANDIIVFNPDISVKNSHVVLARKLGKRVENEATIFYELCDKPIVAITGTRGKTTTATWTHHLLGRTATIAGNHYDHSLLDVLDVVSKYKTVVNEIPSYHLEFFPLDFARGKPSTLMAGKPHIAVITNISRDHMNRHDNSIEDYATTKGNIFLNQTVSDHLILNYDDPWTKFFLKQKPKSKIWYFSVKPLRANERGIFVKNEIIYLRDTKKNQKLFSVKNFARDFGEHNLKNFLASVLAAHLAGVSWIDIEKRMKNLPGIPFRQEIVFKSPKLTIINDTTATSPEGGIAAIERFASPSTILITGGTDRGLDYADWAKVVRKKVVAKNLILLSGSATEKMKKALGAYAKNIRTCDSLKVCFDAALARASGRKTTIVFSPASKSFEKFKNEYDRGEQFNQLIGPLKSK